VRIRKIKRDKTRKVLLLFFVIFIMSFPMPLFAYNHCLNHKIITFESDPIKIQKATIQVIEEKYSDKIRCKVMLANKEKPVEAYALGFIFYDVFNEHLDTIGGISMSGIAEKSNDTVTWEFKPYKAWMAYTAIIYLSKVRFADGTVWRQDKHKLAKKITEVTDLMFKEEQLEEKK